jgi:hypothetical protein
MNERIKELELQAADGTVDPNGPFTAEEFNNFTKKFAELIVSECATVGFEAVANGDLVEDSILTHFGVES